MDQSLSAAGPAELRSEMLREGSAWLAVRGNSMRPFLKEGQLVRIEPASSADVVVGDIVVVDMGGTAVCHRVFRKSGDTIQTKGDDSAMIDPPVGYSDLIGRAVEIGTRDRLSRLCAFVSTRFGSQVSRVTTAAARAYPLLGFITGRGGRSVCRPSKGSTARSESGDQVADRLLGLLQGVNGTEAFPSEKIPELSQSEWRRFTRIAFEEGVSGLVYRNACDRGLRGGFPDEVFSALESDYLINVGRNMLIKNRIMEIAGALQSSGTKTILLRVEHLFRENHPWPDVKAPADIDIVVSRRDFSSASEVLEKLDYSPRPDQPYIFMKDEIPIDVHLGEPIYWRNRFYSSPFSINDEDLWRSCDSIDENLPDIRIMPVTEAALCACAHAQDHCFRRLIWLLDAAATVLSSEEEFRWGDFVDRARGARLRKPAYFVMRFLNEKDLLRVPPGILAALGSVPLNIFERKLLRMLLENRRSNVPGDWLYVFTLRGTWDRIKYVVGAALGSTGTGA